MDFIVIFWTECVYMLQHILLEVVVQFWKMVFAFFLGLMMVFGLAMAGDGIGSEVRQACGTCHSLKPLCAQLEGRSEAGWKTMIRSMIARGAKMAPGRIDSAAAYLADLKQGDSGLCK